MEGFSFDEGGSSGSRYGNNRMDTLLAGEMSQQIPQQSQSHSKTSMSNALDRQEQQKQENFQNERNYQQQQQQNLSDVTQQNTISNSKNLGYDPSEYEVFDDKQLSSVNDVNLFIRIMLGIILFFQIFIIFRLFAHQQNSN